MVLRLTTICVASYGVPRWPAGEFSNLALPDGSLILLPLGNGAVEGPVTLPSGVATMIRLRLVRSRLCLSRRLLRSCRYNSSGSVNGRRGNPHGVLARRTVFADAASKPTTLIQYAVSGPGGREDVAVAWRYGRSDCHCHSGVTLLILAVDPRWVVPKC